MALSFPSKNVDASKDMGLLNKHERLVFSGTRVNPMRTFPLSGDGRKAQCFVEFSVLITQVACGFW